MRTHIYPAPIPNEEDGTKNISALIVSPNNHYTHHQYVTNSYKNMPEKKYIYSKYDKDQNVEFTKRYFYCNHWLWSDQTKIDIIPRVK